MVIQILFAAGLFIVYTIILLMLDLKGSTYLILLLTGFLLLAVQALLSHFHLINLLRKRINICGF